MTIDELKDTRLFKLLDVKEQDWVNEYLTNGGNVDAATKHAFDTTTDRAMRLYGKRMLNSTRVSAVLAAWNGELDDEPSIDQFRRELWRQAKECETDGSRAALMRLYAESRGWIKQGKGVTIPPADDRTAILESIENPQE